MRSEWNAIDLHMHTVVGVTGDGKSDEIKNFTYLNYINALKECDIKLAAITNHNWIDLKNYIMCRHLARKQGINILYGVEIDTNRETGENFHFVAIFDEELDKCLQISELINDKTNEKKIKHEVRYTPDEIVDLIKNYNVVIVPHGDKSKGVFNRATEQQIREALKKVRDGFIRVFDSPSDWKLERIKSLIKDGTIADFDDDFGGVLFSDNRDWLNYKHNFRNFYMNAEPTFKGFLHSITNPVHRFSPKELIPSKSKYVSKIEIRKMSDTARIDNCDIYLDSGYNCIIGKSGSGKSLLHYLISSGINGKNTLLKYGFSNQNSVTLYDENNQKIEPQKINVGIGKKIFDKIIIASTTKDSVNMYEVISILNKDFQKQTKFNAFVEEYKQRLRDYVKINTDSKNELEEYNTNINLFESQNIELLNMKDVHTFSFDIPDDVNYEYSNASLLKLNSIYKNISGIKEAMLYFKEESQEIFNSKINELETLYFAEMKKIYLKMYHDKLTNKRRGLIRNALAKVNSGISANAKKKTLIINSMSGYISNITNSLLKNHLLVKAKENFDLSITTEKIDLEGDLIPDSGITFSEKIDKNIIEKLDIRSNPVFYTYGIQQSLISKSYDFRKKSDAKAVVDKYISLGKMGETEINKVFGDTKIDVDVYFDKQNVKELNPGDISKKYIKTYFENELANGKNTIILYDQIENDVDKPFISDTLIDFIEDMKRKAQVIIVTHDPIVAVNADPINYIEATKDEQGIIRYRNFRPESEDKDELSTIASCVDGSKSVIRERYEIYRGDKTYAD